jgi:glucosamine--fructose-6-phosphate aminotransferase (isomerizing)
LQNFQKDLKKYFADKKHQTVLKKLAKKLVKQDHVFVLGKNQHFYTALEGALKIKEITYKHFEGFSAGELKHGVIALIEKGTPVIGVVGGTKQEQNDVLSSLIEVKARKAKVIGIADKTNEFFDIHLYSPDGGELDAVAKVVPFQLLSYYLAIELKNDPDKPRNLAKSVTVK